MSASNLKGFKVAILVTNAFEQVELQKPKEALEKAGATVKIVSPVNGTVKGWDHDKPKDDFKVDVPLADAKADDFDALVLPGGVSNPDKLRMDEKAVAFAKAFKDKPIGAICHGPWLLINAELVKNKKVTSYPSLKIDLINAGAKWVDQEVVRDGKLITSRKPDDLPAFNKALVELFAENLKP